MRYTDPTGETAVVAGAEAGFWGGMAACGPYCAVAGAVIGTVAVAYVSYEAAQWVGNQLDEAAQEGSGGASEGGGERGESSPTSAGGPNDDDNQSSGGGRSGSGKNEPHGDKGRAKTKANKQIDGYKEKLKTATGNEKKRLNQKIQNVRQNAEKKAKGDTDHMRGNRQ